MTVETQVKIREIKTQEDLKSLGRGEVFMLVSERNRQRRDYLARVSKSAYRGVRYSYIDVCYREDNATINDVTILIEKSEPRGDGVKSHIVGLTSELGDTLGRRASSNFNRLNKFLAEAGL